MRRTRTLLVCILWSAGAGPALAQEGPQIVDPRAIEASTSPGRFLPGAIAPDVGGALVAGLGWAGYDGAMQAPLLGASAEGRLGSRVVIGVGATYAPASMTHPGEVRPSLVLRIQILDSARHGIDGGLAVAYREDRFVGEDGFFQATASVGRRAGRGFWIVNAAFGTDGEGDDREGEVRAAGLARVAGNLHVGLDARYRHEIGSTDPNREAHGTPSMEYMAGPVATLMVGSLAVTAQAGMTGYHTDRLHDGIAALGGVGAVF